MLRSRDIPESKSASESNLYSDLEIVCPSRLPRCVCLCVIAAAGALSALASFCELQRNSGSLLLCALRGAGEVSPRLAFCDGVGLGILCVLFQDMKLD